MTKAEHCLSRRRIELFDISSAPGDQGKEWKGRGVASYLGAVFCAPFCHPSSHGTPHCTDPGAEPIKLDRETWR